MSDGAPAGLAAVAVELARAQLEAGRPLVTRAAGQSMWPLLRDGDRVSIQPLGGGALRVGDVALVALGGRLVLHRIIAVRGQRVVTKGDAMALADPALPLGDVLGRVARRPWDRWVAEASRRGGAPLSRVVGLARRALERRRG